MAGDLDVRDARLLDGRGGDPVEPATMLCRDGLIVFAGSDADAPSLDAADHVVDAEGRALIPGLIDAHVHLCFDGEPDFEAAARIDPAKAALKGARNAVRALHAGITSVRDLGGVGRAALDLAWAQREGVIPGPRIIAAGQVLTITGGHGHYIGLEVDTIDEIVTGVRRLVKAGAGVIKIMATGGVLTAGIGATRSTFTVEQIAAAVGEARAAGLRVAAHAHGAAGILTALRGGVDSIEHCSFLDDESLKLLQEQTAWVVPTLVAPYQITRAGGGVPDYAVRKSLEVIDDHRASIGRAFDGGARIAAGTDAGTPYNHHGGLSLELRLMHEAGMPLDAVFRAATLEATALLGIDEEVGSLEEGKVADFVLLDGDPLDDVRAYEPQRVALVAQGGRVSVGRLT